MYLRCFLVGLPCVVGRWLRISDRGGNIVCMRDPLLRYARPVGVVGGRGCQTDSLRGPLYIF